MDFETIDITRDHIKNVHPIHTSKPFVCSECDKCFSDKQKLDSHIETAHTCIEPVSRDRECEIDESLWMRSA